MFWLQGIDYHCSFEDNSWCGITQPGGDFFPWSLTDQATPSKDTGPDHAYDGRLYVFIEASGRDFNDAAR